jgi:phosphoribosyl-AMP cyclohydrolase
VLWLKVEQSGAGACHTGRRSCFYRAVVSTGPGAPPALEFRDERVFDPREIYDAANNEAASD